MGGRELDLSLLCGEGVDQIWKVYYYDYIHLRTDALQSNI